MGRTEQPVDPTSMAAELALALRQLRDARGFTYRELAELTYYHPSVLCRAARGVAAPRWEVVVAFVQACTPAAEPSPCLGVWRALWIGAGGRPEAAR